MTGRVWIVEDDAEMAELLRSQLARRGYEACELASASAALERFSRDGADVVVTDIRMRGVDGIHSALDTAVAAIRAGGFDFLAKPFEIEELVFRIERALQHRRLSEEVKRLRAALHGPVEELAGESEAMGRLRDLVARMHAFGEQLESFCKRISDELVFERADLTDECSAVRDAYRRLLDDARARVDRSDAGV